MARPTIAIYSCFFEHAPRVYVSKGTRTGSLRFIYEPGPPQEHMERSYW